MSQMKLKKVVRKEPSSEEVAPKEKTATPEPIDTSEVSVPEHGKLTELEEYMAKARPTSPDDMALSENAGTSLDTVTEPKVDVPKKKAKKPKKLVEIKSDEQDDAIKVDTSESGEVEAELLVPEEGIAFWMYCIIWVDVTRSLELSYVLSARS